MSKTLSAFMRSNVAAYHQPFLCRLSPFQGGGRQADGLGNLLHFRR